MCNLTKYSEMSYRILPQGQNFSQLAGQTPQEETVPIQGPPPLGIHVGGQPHSQGICHSTFFILQPNSQDFHQLSLHSATSILNPTSYVHPKALILHQREAVTLTKVSITGIPPCFSSLDTHLDIETMVS